MGRTSVVESQEELKSDLCCLKRKLGLILEENQMMKLRIRRLENELRCTDKYNECCRVESSKDRQRIVRSFHGDGTAVVHNLRMKNRKFENTIVDNDLKNAKRLNNVKTMCLYSHPDGKQVNRRGSKITISGRTRLNSGQDIDSSSKSLHERVGSSSRLNLSKKPGRVWSADSLDERSISKNRGEPDDSATIIKTLQSEIVVDKRTIRLKNNEIFRLSAELRDAKNLLISQDATKIARSTSTTELQPQSIINNNTTAKLISENLIEDKKTNRRNCHRKIIEKTDSPKLPTVRELNEETNLPSETFKVSKIIDKNDLETKTLRPKTRIEYVYDSEVSSDDDEFCLSNNLRTFLQRAVNST